MRLCLWVLAKTWRSRSAFGGVCVKFFERTADGKGFQPTWLGSALLADDGWDPFLVTPTSSWLLHYQIAAHPEAAFTWYYTFNRLRRGEFSSTQLVEQISALLAEQGVKLPAPATLRRDVDCMLRCYVRPDAALLGPAAEDALHCPLHLLDLIRALPGQASYQLVRGAQPELPDALVAFAALQQARMLKRATVALNELAYGECSPGQIFRLDEDSLLARLLHLEALTDGQALYTESAGIRQIAWRNPTDPKLDCRLLDLAFAQEQRYV